MLKNYVKIFWLSSCVLVLGSNLQAAERPVDLFDFKNALQENDGRQSEKIAQVLLTRYGQQYRVNLANEITEYCQCFGSNMASKRVSGFLGIQENISSQSQGLEELMSALDIQDGRLAEEIAKKLVETNGDSYKLVLQEKMRRFSESNRARLRVCAALDLNEATFQTHENRSKPSTFTASQARDIAISTHMKNVRDHDYTFLDASLEPDKVLSNSLPRSLRSLPGVQVLYYASPTDDSIVPGTCGSRTLANAAAISIAVDDNNLSAQRVFSQASKFSCIHVCSKMGSTEMIEDAVAANMKNIHSFAFVPTYHLSKQNKENPFSIIASSEYWSPINHLQNQPFIVNFEDEPRFQDRIMRAIRGQQNCVTHFCCAVDVKEINDHAVLISIVKRAGQIPAIIYMDCNNCPLSSKAAAFIHYLYLMCIA